MVCKRGALVNIIDKGTNGSSQHTEVPNEQGFLNAQGLETSWFGNEQDRNTQEIGANRS